MRDEWARLCDTFTSRHRWAGWTHVVRDGGCIRCIRCYDREAWAVGEPVCWPAVTFEEFDRQVTTYFQEAL